MQPGAGARILLIDDDARLADMVGRYLSQSGFALMHRPDARSGLAALTAAGPERASGAAFEVPALILLDLMLPDADGLDVCRDIRHLPGPVAATPILMLTARGEITDRVVGLELGADDYLPKPFEPRELLARVRALLRRSGLTAAAAGAGGAAGTASAAVGAPAGAAGASAGAGAAAAGAATAGAAADAGSAGSRPGSPRLVFGRLEIDPDARQVRLDGNLRPLTAYQFDL
ncbi:MAG: response regulator transcription factor, partial [Lautropia sp.]